MMQRSRRFVIVLGVFMFVGLLALTGRAAWLTVGTHEDARARMERQSSRVADVEARRGSLFDRHGRVLASSVATLQVELLPANLRRRAADEQAEAELIARVADFLAPLVMAPREELIRRMSGSKWTVLGEPVEGSVELDSIEAERRDLLYGLDLRHGFRRRYPWGRAAGNLIGYVNHEGKGVSGLEAGLDDMLAGVDGLRQFRVDHKGREVADHSGFQVDPVDGLDVTLTLDARVQQILEEEAQLAMEAAAADGVTVVAMDPRTGDVLGMCSVPGLDLSDRTDRPKEGSVCAALQEIYPPGSTFKPLMMAAALELGLVDADGPPVDCRAFNTNRKRRIRDTHPKSDPLSLEEIIVHSSNIGMANILTRLVPLDQDRNTALMRPLYELLMRLGLDRRTGLPVPAEVSGSVTQLEDWTRTYTLASVAFGQELGVSATQMAAAASTLHDGLYRPPRLVQGCTDAEGRLMSLPAPRPTHVFRPAVARQVREYMVRAVEEGACEEVKLPGIAVAGKTGTAQCEADLGTEVHSYIALVPAERPELSLVVVVRDPKGEGLRYASMTAAPAAGKILRRVLPYLGHPLPEGK